MSTAEPGGGHEGWNTMQNDSGRKNMLTNVSNLIFSRSRVEALLSITALALNNYHELAYIVQEQK